jgi:arylsulfatase A-like enzyme
MAMRRSWRALALGLLGVSGLGDSRGAAASRPNVLVIMSDDQGHGDLGLHGNPVIRTPNLDRLGREGTRLTRFQVAPVCAPTRASLMTGRYHYRTGVVDTFLGRALMHTDEVTLAEMVSAAGYRTGIFGKWHLGDCAPMRPIDQGFQEALVIRGGGIGQPSDPPGGSSYFDPIVQHNGQPETRRGYCSDVFTDAAIAFIADDSGQGPERRPFLAYLAYNAPHAPLEVPEAYRQPYAKADLSDARFPVGGYPLPGPTPADATARVYGMVTNLDDNVGRLLARLDDLGLADETLVIFLTDNGPHQVRYVSGFRGRKGTVYDGGIRVPCFWRWPGHLAPGRTIDRIASVIDLAPTILEACGVAAPEGVKFDGVSLWPLLAGKVDPAAWPDRVLFTQWHRGDAPEKYRAFAARDQRFKLVRAERPARGAAPPFELFDTEADPYERHDLAGTHPEVVERLKRAYSAWLDDVSRPRGFDPPPRIDLGSPREDPTVLTPQDWRGPRAGGPDGGLGYWEVRVFGPLRCRVTLAVRPAPAARIARLKLGGLELATQVGPGAEVVTFEPVTLPAGPGRLEAQVDLDGRASGVRRVEIRRLD